MVLWEMVRPARIELATDLVDEFIQKNMGGLDTEEQVLETFDTFKKKPV